MDWMAACTAGVSGEFLFSATATFEVCTIGCRTSNVLGCCLAAHTSEVESYITASIRLETTWVNASFTLGRVTAAMAGFPWLVQSCWDSWGSHLSSWVLPDCTPTRCPQRV